MRESSAEQRLSVFLLLYSLPAEVQRCMRVLCVAGYPVDEPATVHFAREPDERGTPNSTDAPESARLRLCSPCRLRASRRSCVRQSGSLVRRVCMQSACSPQAPPSSEDCRSSMSSASARARCSPGTSVEDRQARHNVYTFVLSGAILPVKQDTVLRAPSSRPLSVSRPLTERGQVRGRTIYSRQLYHRWSWARTRTSSTATSRCQDDQAHAHAAVRLLLAGLRRLCADKLEEPDASGKAELHIDWTLGDSATCVNRDRHFKESGLAGLGCACLTSFCSGCGGADVKSLVPTETSESGVAL